MTLRQRSAIVIVTAVMLMLIAFSVLIYYLLVNNHRNQFHSILRDKAIQTVKLLDEVKEVDSTLLSIIDAQTLHELRDEKTLVLDSTGEIVYSSADDHRISWDKNLLKRIRQEGIVYFSEGEYETAGIFYSEGSITRFILVAAKDAGGKQLFRRWAGLLSISVVVILLIILLTSYFFAGRALEPLSILQRHILQSAAAPHAFTELKSELLHSKDEIASLANSYNELMRQLQQYDAQQKQFIRFASHELRTPLAVLMSQIDHALLRERNSEEYRTLLISLQKDHDQLAQLISRLLFISKSDQLGPGDMKSRVSLYAVAEDCIDKIGQQHPEVKFSLSFSQSPTNPEDYDMSGDEVLLQAAIENMLSNAVKYGAGTPVAVLLTTDKEQVSIEVMNGGPLIANDEVDQLFTPFFRASNKGRQPGSGLGLVLLQKVVHCHGGSIDYRIRDGQNAFFIQFPRSYNP
jgi:signal transduction histidine kinase